MYPRIGLNARNCWVDTPSIDFGLTKLVGCGPHRIVDAWRNSNVEHSLFSVGYRHVRACRRVLDDRALAGFAHTKSNLGGNGANYGAGNHCAMPSQWLPRQ